MICIVDYGSGNVGALANLLKRSRIPHFISGEPNEMSRADRYILPGVGAFDPTIEQLGQSGILEVLNDEVHRHGKPVLGICVGMHLLAEESEEGVRKGLGWVPGKVRKIDTSLRSRPPFLPHMGWNTLSKTSDHPLFEGIDCALGFYYLHSYFFDAKDDRDVMARVPFGTQLPCAVARGNVYGVQFHPEKSHSNGTRLLENFSRLS